MEVLEIQKQCLSDSERWFPEVSHSLEHMTLGITGELGEFCNLLKKINRGSLELTEETHVELAFELCDVFIYLCNMAAVMNVDLGRLYELKRDYNEKRFGASSPDNAGGDVEPDESIEVPNGPSSFVPVSEISKPL